MASGDAILAHVVSQMEANVSFLQSHGYIAPADADAILSRLPAANGSALAVGSAAPLVRAKALWPYNESGTEKADLSFNEGDIIEIVTETNADWWTGRCKGREGIFPSNHVEKLPAQSASSPPPQTTRKPYKPFGAALHGYDAPPPVNAPAAPVHYQQAPPPPQMGATNSIGLQQDPGQAAKKKKFGKYGDTMAHSAAGGVGFGAGAAIGGGLVRAIF